jgi:hypothetical protein
MENSQTQTQPKPRKKRKIQEPSPDPNCPYKDAISHAEASRILGLVVHDAKILMERRGISGYKGLKYVYRSKKEVITKGFFWKYKDKGHCIDFAWAQRILGLGDVAMQELEFDWKKIGEKEYCTAKEIIDLLYGPDHT